MGVVFRQSIKSTIATLFGAILGALIIYLSARFIPKQEFGFRSTLTNYAVVAGQILIIGLGNMITVFANRYASEDKRTHVLVSASLVLPFVFIATATLIYCLLRQPIIGLFKPEDIPFIKQYFLWLPVFTLLFGYNVVVESYLIAHVKAAVTTFIREVLLRMLNIALIVLFGLGIISYDLLIYGTVLIYLISLSVLIVIAAKTDGFVFTAKWNVFEKKERNEIIHFTWYHSLLNVSVLLIGMLDALMLATLSPSGLKAIPVYTVSVFIISFLLIPYKAMLQSAMASLIDAFKHNDIPRIKDLFTRTSINMFIATMAMFLLIICNMHNAIKLLPDGYEAITIIVVILALGRMVDMVTGMNDQVLSLSNHYKYSFYISITLVFLVVAFNWIMIPRYDIYGAAWATTAALIIFNTMKLLVVKRKLGLQPISYKTLLVVLSAGVAFAAGYLIPKTANPFIDAAFRSLSIIAVYSGMLVWLRPSADLNDYLASIRKNKRLF